MLLPYTPLTPPPQLDTAIALHSALAGLNAHASHRAVADHGLALLVNLSGTPSCVSVMRAAGARSVVARVQTAHSTNATLAGWARQLLGLFL